jgi:dihydroorotase
MAEDKGYALNLADARKQDWAGAGYDTKFGGWRIPYSLLEPHDHVRDPVKQYEMFDLVVPETAKLYDWSISMPNLAENRILTPEQAIAYRAQIVNYGRRYNPHFNTWVPFYIEAGLDPEVIAEGYRRGAWKCGKLYPKNGTTNSDWGVDFRKIRELFPIFAMMERLGMWLLVHGEVVHNHKGELVADRKREPRAVNVIELILKHFPKLKVVFEHMSKKESVRAFRRWKAAGYQVEATIAPHYLIWNSTALFEKGMNGVRYSIPILGDEEDRLALIQLLMDGFGMAGKDSAPHDITAKSKPEGCPGGVFSAPVGLYVYFHLFRVHGGPNWFEKFLDFQCRRAAKWYELGEMKLSQTIIREEGWNVPKLYGNGNAKVIPLFAGKVMHYSSERIAA